VIGRSCIFEKGPALFEPKARGEMEAAIKSFTPLVTLHRNYEKMDLGSCLLHFEGTRCWKEVMVGQNFRGWSVVVSRHTEENPSISQAERRQKIKATA